MSIIVALILAALGVYGDVQMHDGERLNADIQARQSAIHAVTVDPVTNRAEVLR